MKRVIAESLAAVEGVLKERCEVHILLKLHPSEQEKSFYHEWVRARGLSARVTIIENYDPLLLAKAADFLIVYNSTYAVDGFAMDRRVILLHDDSWFLEEFKMYRIFEYAGSPDELQAAIFKLLAKPEGKPGRWQEARRECLNEDGIDAEEYIVACLTGEKIP